MLDSAKSERVRLGGGPPRALLALALPLTLLGGACASSPEPASPLKPVPSVEPSTCSSRILAAQPAETACGESAELRGYLTGLGQGIAAENTPLRYSERASALILFSEAGIEEICVPEATSAEVRREVEAALARARAKARGAPPACAHGARQYFTFGDWSGHVCKMRGKGEPADVPIRRVAPRYPTAASNRGQNGWVVLAAKIDEHGNVVDIEVVESEPGRVFDKAAKKALSKWKYCPGEAGRPIQIKLDFWLEPAT